MQYEMLVGESPFYDENEHKMLSRIAYSDVVSPRTSHAMRMTS